MVNETELADAIYTAKRRLQIMLDLFDDALVSSRGYSPAVEGCFDDAHFMAHQALEGLTDLERQAEADVAAA